MTVENPDRRTVWFQLQIGSRLLKPLYAWKELDVAIADAQEMANLKRQSVAVVRFITAKTPGNKPERSLVRTVPPRS